MNLYQANLQEKSKLKGTVRLFSGKAHNIQYDENGLIAAYEFEEKKLIKQFRNIVCTGYYGFIATGWAAPCVIAIGNGDNGVINGTGGLVNSVNAPNVNDQKLNNELSNGRFPCVNLTKFNTTNGTATFNALYPRNNFSGQVTEFGLFFGQINSVAINTINSGTLIARTADDFTKNATDDVEIVWTIQTILN